jgi:hypothetical protein
MYMRYVSAVESDRAVNNRDGHRYYRRKRASECGAAYDHHHRVNMHVVGHVGEIGEVVDLSRLKPKEPVLGSKRS